MIKVSKDLSRNYFIRHSINFVVKVKDQKSCSSDFSRRRVAGRPWGRRLTFRSCA